MNVRLSRYVLIPPTAGLHGALVLMGVYLAIVSVAETPVHAQDLFWEDRFFVIPILIGLGVQAGLFARLKLGAPAPTGAAGGTTGSGSVSMAAMVTCCADDVADVVPVLGLSAAAAFLEVRKIPFLVVGLLTNLAGIAVMVRAFRRLLPPRMVRPAAARSVASGQRAISRIAA